MSRRPHGVAAAGRVARQRGGRACTRRSCRRGGRWRRGRLSVRVPRRIMLGMGTPPRRNPVSLGADVLRAALLSAAHDCGLKGACVRAPPWVWAWHRRVRLGATKNCVVLLQEL